MNAKKNEQTAPLSKTPLMQCGGHRKSRLNNLFAGRRSKYRWGAEPGRISVTGWRVGVWVSEQWRE